MTSDDIKTIGIVGGLVVSAAALFLNSYSTWRSIRSQRTSSYQEIVKSHREIWKLTLDDPSMYGRVFELNVDLLSTPMSYHEKLFSHLLFLHMTSAYVFQKYSQMLPIEQVELDFHEVLLAPIPRLVWAEKRRYYNSNFRRFLENASKPRGIRKVILRILKKLGPDHTKPWHVLVLGDSPDDIVRAIARLGDRVIGLPGDAEVSRSYIRENGIDYVICVGYHGRLSPEVLSAVPCISIHGGYLPYDGDPNSYIWAWLDGSPKGVSIHNIDTGAGTGNIIAQRGTSFTEPVTIRSVADTTAKECRSLFADEWPRIRSGAVTITKHKGKRTIHTLESRQLLDVLLTESDPDMPIHRFCKKAQPLIDGTESAFAD